MPGWQSCRMRSGTVATMPPEAATPARKTVAGVTALLVGLALTSLIGFRMAPLGGSTTATIWQAGTPLAGAPGRTESVAGLMHDQLIADRSGQPPVHPKPEEEGDFRQGLPENPGSPDVSQLPAGTAAPSKAPSTPQTVGTSFTGATISDTGGLVPPDSMGAVGPTQFIVTVNGRFRSFSKA